MPNIHGIERICEERGFRMTEPRRIIARVLSEAQDHPDVETLHRRVTRIDDRIALATIYRAVSLFEEMVVLERHNFGDGRARYELAGADHHDHLIDVTTGKVVEFSDKELEQIRQRIADRLGYRLVDHRIELYAVPREGAA